MRLKVSLSSLANGGANSDKIYYETSRVKFHTVRTLFILSSNYWRNPKCLIKTSCLVNSCLSSLQYKRLKQNAFCCQSLLCTMIGPSLLHVSLSELNMNYRPDASLLLPGGELPYEEYMRVCHELGSYFQEKIPKRVCQFFTKIPKRAIISVRNSR